MRFFILYIVLAANCVFAHEIDERKLYRFRSTVSLCWINEIVNIYARDTLRDNILMIVDVFNCESLENLIDLMRKNKINSELIFMSPEYSERGIRETVLLYFCVTFCDPNHHYDDTFEEKALQILFKYRPDIYEKIKK